LAVTPTRESCTFVLAFQMERGQYGSVSLEGLGFIVLGLTPGPMGNGNWSIGVIADDRPSTEQREAITAIASGSGGRPMAALSPLVDALGVQWSDTSGKNNGQYAPFSWRSA
jgi:hypothetical protein